MSSALACSRLPMRGSERAADAQASPAHLAHVTRFAAWMDWTDGSSARERSETARRMPVAAAAPLACRPNALLRVAQPADGRTSAHPAGRRFHYEQVLTHPDSLESRLCNRRPRWPCSHQSRTHAPAFMRALSSCAVCRAPPQVTEGRHATNEYGRPPDGVRGRVDLQRLLFAAARTATAHAQAQAHPWRANHARG